MLAIRLQRTGRSGHAQFRVIVQDDRFSPKSGRVVAYVGNYDPHSKSAKLDNEKISQYLSSGAQPSSRMVQLLKKEGIKLPSWVSDKGTQKRSIRHPEKLRRNRPKDAAPTKVEPAETAETVVGEPTPEPPPEVINEPAAAEEPPKEPAGSVETPSEAEPPEPEPPAEDKA